MTADNVSYALLDSTRRARQSAMPPRADETQRADRAGSSSPLAAWAIDDEPALMDESFRLRHQVYCVEREFLKADEYPDRRERDEFDRYSIHLGVFNRQQEMVATSRLVRSSILGLPLFRHCQIDADEQELYRDTHRMVEVSRLCMSRRHRQGARDGASIAVELYRATYQTSKRLGFTHWLVATEPSFQRLVSRLGFPFRAVGPITDYYGPVAPYVMDLEEFDQVILSGTKPALAPFLRGLEPQFRPAARPRAA